MKKVDHFIELFAFWRYDVFPYILGGSVTKMHEDGSVETREYGRGHRFLPIKLLPLTQGLSLMKEIKSLEKERNTALEKFNQNWQNEISKLAPFAKKT